LLACVLAYAGFNVKRLIDENQRKEAAALIAIILIMIVLALIVVPLSLSLFKRAIA
jgi:predicted nucleic acid-binding Zn ribbon protein